MPRTSTAAVAPRALEISHKLVPLRNATYPATITPMKTVLTASFQVRFIVRTTFPLPRRCY